MGEFMESKPEMLTNSVQEGIERAMKGKYAFLMESPSLQYQVDL